jgi:hypothetical protein
MRYPSEGKMLVITIRPGEKMMRGNEESFFKKKLS